MLNSISWPHVILLVMQVIIVLLYYNLCVFFGHTFNPSFIFCHNEKFNKGNSYKPIFKTDWYKRLSQKLGQIPDFIFLSLIMFFKYSSSITFRIQLISSLYFCTEYKGETELDMTHHIWREKGCSPTLLEWSKKKY